MVALFVSFARIVRGDFPVVALVGEGGSLICYTAEGVSSLTGVNPSLDLVKTSPAEGLKVDDPVWVRGSDEEEWTLRYFTKYEDGHFYTWGGGETSHTGIHVLAWKHFATINPYTRG